jgi:uncharacterized membrane protein YdbT with pleckstrin-like domain
MYTIPGIFVALALITITIPGAIHVHGSWYLVLAWAAVAAIAYGWCKVIFNASEFAVTGKRVIIKVGVIRRRTLETMLSKVEAIEVDQTVVGRMLNYGTLIVTGTGGTKEAFKRISHPLEFRRQVQAAVSSAEDARGYIAPGSAAGAADRQERDCPFCAERILVAAKVCKHCGRNVETGARV